MSLDLSTINFSVNTKPLEAAAAAIGELVTNVGQLDKAAKTAAQTEALLARAAKDNAKANLDNAKAQDQRLKSTITADKADQAAADAIEKKTKATERASAATKKNIDILQLQNDTYDFILEGFSKGDAKVLAMAKSTGQLSDQLKQVLTDIRQFSKNTFDQTETGLDRMVKSAKEASSAQGFLNNGLNLTSKQAKELSNDLDRLNIRLQHQGKSYQEITKEQAIYKQRFVEEANAVNRATSALAAVEKQRKDVVSATNYLTQAEAKMAAALNTSNVALDRAGTDSLVKYEAALRKSGISQDAATAKLATYKAQLTQVAGLEEKRRAQHLARALQPQFTDIAVSLYSGQSPLTVLLQQSGQMVDLFKLSGIEADNLGKVMREAFASMIPAIATVAKGLTSLVFESFMSAGSAVTSFVGNVTGITATMEIAKRAIVSGGEANFKYIASLDKIGETFSAVAATGIAAMIAGMILLGLEYKKIIQAEAELTNALAISGGALGISKTEAVAAAEGMASLGVGTLKAVAAITEIAKAGNIGKESLELITKSAIDLEKTAGISIEETAKQFAKLQEEPAKALTEIAQKTGLVDKATLDYVYALEQQGDKTEAARVATLALASANAQVASEVRDNWSPIEVLWNDIKSAIGSVKQEIYDLTTSNAVVGALRTVWETVAVVISEVWFTIKGVGKEIGGIGAQIAAVMQGDFSGAAEIGRMMKADAAAAAEEQKKYVDAILNRTSVEQKSFNQSKEQNSQYAAWRKDNEKALEKQYSKTERLAQKEKQLQADVTAGIIDEAKATEALAGWKRIIMGDKTPKADKQPIKDLETEIDLRNKSLGLLSSFNNELDAIERRRAATGDEDQYQKSLNELIAKQPIYLERQKEINAAHELTNRLFGEADGLGKSYYKTLEQINKEEASGLRSPENAEKARQAAFEQTKLAKDELKYITASTEATKKYTLEMQKSLGDAEQQNQLLDNRVSLLGLTSEQARLATIEQEKQNKLLKVRLDYEQQIQKIDLDKDLDPWAKEKLKIKAAKLRAEQEKTINREVAVQYASDLDREIRSINSGITESIVTALFEGGQAGGKKLRDVITGFLRQKFTIVVDAVVNTLIGGVVGNLVRAVSGGVTGIVGAAGSAASGAGALGNAGSIFSGISALAGNFGAGLTTGFQGLMAGNLGSTLSLGGGLIGSGATAGGIGTIVGALAPMAVGIGALVSIATKGETRTGGQFGVAYDGAVTNERRGQTYLIEGQQFDRDFTKGLQNSLKNGIAYRLEGDPVAQEDAIRNAVSGTAQGINAILESLGSKAALTGFSAGLETSSKGRGGVFAGGKLSTGATFGESGKGDNYDGTLYEKFSTNSPDFKTALENFTLDLKQSTIQALQVVSDIPDTIKQMVSGVDAEALTTEAADSLLNTINAQVTAVNTVRDAFAPLGGIFQSIASASFDAQSRLINLSGGLDKFLQNANQFVQQYYSQTEQQAIAATQLSTTLTNVGLNLTELGVDTKDEFRKLVESIDVNTDGGQEQVAALLAVAPQFSDLVAFLSENNMTMQQLLDQSPQIEAIDKLLSPQEQTAQATAESAKTLTTLVGATNSVASSIDGLASSMKNSTVNVTVNGKDTVTVPKFASGGSFSGGLRLVGEKGPELEVTGSSSIYSTSNTTSMLAKAVEQGFIAGASKATLAVAEPKTAAAKTPVDIFLLKFRENFPEFAARLNESSLSYLTSKEFMTPFGSRLTEDLLTTVFKMLESGTSAANINEYLSFVTSNDNPVPSSTGTYVDQYTKRKEWGWNLAQIKAEIGSGQDAEQVLKTLYSGVVSSKELESISDILYGATNSLGITQDNLKTLFEAGVLKDYLTKQEDGTYKLGASELFTPESTGAGGVSDEEKRMLDLLNEQRQLEIRLLQAQGKDQEAANRIREDAIKGLSAETIAIYDRNRALEEEIRVQESLNAFAQESKQLQAELLNLQGDAAGAKAILRELAIKGLSEVEIAAYDANEALRDQIAAFNSARDAVSNALEGVSNAIQAEKDRLNEEFQKESDILNDRISAIKSVVDTLSGALKTIKNSVEETSIVSQNAARLMLQSVVTAVRGGADVTGFSSVIEQSTGALSNNAPELYATQQDFLRAQYKSIGLIEELQNLTDDQLTTAEKSLKELKDGFDASIKRLDDVLAEAKKQVNILLGIDQNILDGTLSVTDALARLQQAILAASQSNKNTGHPLQNRPIPEGTTGGVNPGPWKPETGPQGQVADMFRAVLGRDPTQTAVDYYTGLMNSGNVNYDSITEIRDVIRDNAINNGELKGYASGGMYPGGMALVGEEGPELINFNSPGMVYTSAQTRGLMQQDNSELIAELQSLRQEVSMLRAEARATAVNTGKSARILDDVTQGGTTVQTTVV